MRVLQLEATGMISRIAKLPSANSKQIKDKPTALLSFNSTGKTAISLRAQVCSLVCIRVYRFCERAQQKENTH